MPYQDCADYAIETLKATSALTDLIMYGEDGIFEAGDLDTTLISQFENQRRTDNTPQKVLAIVVRDAGEEATGGELQSAQQVAVYIYDRERGYANIRALRQQVYLALHSKSCRLDNPLLGRGVMVQLNFNNRTGYQYERTLDLDFEAILFESVVQYAQP